MSIFDPNLVMDDEYTERLKRERELLQKLYEICFEIDKRPKYSVDYMWSTNAPVVYDPKKVYFIWG